MEAFETFEHAGFTVELHQDWDDPTKPSDWDQAGELVAFDPLWREFRFAERVSDGEEDEALDRGGLPLLARYLRMARGQEIVPFAYVDYGSSGAVLRAVDLDSDRAAGFIVTDAERMDKVGATDADAVLRAELSEWAAYVAGEIVGYVIRDGKGEVRGSCWGFYPDGSRDPIEYVRQEARDEAEGIAELDERRRVETLQGWAFAHGLGVAMPV